MDPKDRPVGWRPRGQWGILQPQWMLRVVSIQRLVVGARDAGPPDPTLGQPWIRPVIILSQPPSSDGDALDTEKPNDHLNLQVTKNNDSKFPTGHLHAANCLKTRIIHVYICPHFRK